MIHQGVMSVGGPGPAAVIAGLAVGVSPWVARWIRFEIRLWRRAKARPQSGWPYW